MPTEKPRYCITVDDETLKEIDDFTAELNNFREKLVSEDVEGMKKLFIQSTERRKLFDKKDVKNRK